VWNRCGRGIAWRAMRKAVLPDGSPANRLNTEGKMGIGGQEGLVANVAALRGFRGSDASASDFHFYCLYCTGLSDCRWFALPDDSPEAFKRVTINRVLNSSGIAAQTNSISLGTRPPASSLSH
jgi:hypothetical protein